MTLPQQPRLNARRHVGRVLKSTFYFLRLSSHSRVPIVGTSHRGQSRNTVPPRLHLHRYQWTTRPVYSYRTQTLSVHFCTHCQRSQHHCISRCRHHLLGRLAKHRRTSANAREDLEHAQTCRALFCAILLCQASRTIICISLSASI